jgi:alpha-1,6-mannosyltransferase
MRIVDVNEFYSPTGGGVRTYLQRKMAIFAEWGHELHVIAPGREDSVEERPGGCIHFVKARPLPFDPNYGLFWDGEPIHVLLDRLVPDVVEASSPWRPAWIVAEWRGRALKSYFMHNDNVAAYPQRWFERVAEPDSIERAFAWYSRYMNRFLDRYDTVLTNGPALQKRLRARGVRVDAAMPLGIESGHFSPALRDEAMRVRLLADLGLPADGLLLLGLGRHHPEKRWPLVVEAVTRAGAHAPVGLMLLGDGADRTRIARAAAGNPHIKLFRPLYDRHALARVMASAEALIHGAEAEPFGLVAAEARASGLPLIAPDAGGCAEIADPAASELYSARDAADCAAAIGRMWHRNPVTLRGAALRAAEDVRTDHEHAAALLDHYAGMIAGSRLSA